MQTLFEIDAALTQMPASPATDADIAARAALIGKRLEFIAAEQRAAATPPPQTGGIMVNVPEHQMVWEFSGRNAIQGDFHLEA